MKCPLCHVTLAPRALDANLAARACARCGGQWVDGARYHRWLETTKKDAATGSPLNLVKPVAGSKRPAHPLQRAGNTLSDATSSIRCTSKVDSDKFTPRPCPTCGRLLLRAKVGHGIAFELDRCGSCGGFWFEAGEWETLRAAGLHDDVHFVFSAAWQADVDREDCRRRHEALLAEKIGPADYAELRRVRAWLERHAHRAELYGVLLYAAEGSGARQT